MKPLRLMVYDQTCAGRGLLPGLTSSWRVGGWLYGALGRLDTHRGAASWDEALDWLASHRSPELISEIQYWGHGHWGRLKLGGDSIDRRVLEPNHRLHTKLVAIRERLAPNATWWFRTCETFGTQVGQEFAKAWSNFFDCRAAGHTYVIGPFQSGLHTLRPGEEPSWPASEGLPSDPPDPQQALWSTPRAPNTITCFRGDIPEGY